MLKYSSGLALAVTLNFLVQSIWPRLIESSLVYSIISIIISIIVLFFYFRELENSKSYLFKIKKSILLGGIAGIFSAVFYLLYTSFIDPNYFQNSIIVLISKLRSSGYDEFSVNKTITLLVATKQYHINEIGIVFSTTLKTLAAALLISPFFIEKKVYA